MKKNVLVLLLFLNSYLFCYSQDRIIVGKDTKHSYSFIETYEQNNYGSKELKLKFQYYYNSNNTEVIKKGIKTALEWVSLNYQHKKEFTKEICRFRGIINHTYNFIKILFQNNDIRSVNTHYDMGGVDFKLVFIGKSDGTSKIQIEVKQMFDFEKMLVLESEERIEKFRDMLDGKSINSDIDDIFKNK